MEGARAGTRTGTETIVVTRDGHRVAMIAPAPRANGKALRELLRGWRGHPAFDEEFEANATARATNRTLVTTDAKAKSESLPGVDARVVTPR
ncbi:hypothetical protein [Saccharothrix xinjiangensis]|uniref:hypothetical protein n=1 Tax=Saccharothrix xinjiangensis TaxID=204798 RepID=UPI0031E25F99